MKIVFRHSLVGIVAAALLLTVSLAGSAAFAGEKDVSKTLQERVAKMTPEQQAALLTLLDQMSAGKDTKTTAATMTPEEASRQALRELETAKAEKKMDVDLLMSHISKDFNHPVVGGKSGLRSWIDSMIAVVSSNGAPDIKVSIDQTKFTIKGDKVEAYPVEVTVPIGSATLTVYGKLEDGVWRVTGVDGV